MADTIKEAKYKLTDDMKKYFCSVLLLENLINFNHIYPIILEGNKVFLEPFLIHMHSKGYVTITSDKYVPTNKGRELLTNYLAKLEEFRRVYRIYSAVDTGSGTFAYEEYFNVDTDEDFDEILNDDSFVDLRIALCELKGINPVEIVFLEFVDGNKFNCEEDDTWEADLATGSIWFEIMDIVNNNIYLDDLAEDNHTGEEVMKLIVEAGSKVMNNLLKIQEEQDELELNLEDDEDEEEYDEEYITYEVEYVEEPIFEIEYYDSYYDPYFCSPIWAVHYY